MDDPGLGRHESRGSNDTGMYNTVDNPIQWEDRVRTLKEIVQSGKIPCLVKVNRTDVVKYCSKRACVQHDEMTEDEILHVLELRRHKMVVARKMQWERRTGDYQETGKQTEINVTQKGWFEVMPENGQPVEYFDTINAIVGIRPKQFLVRTSVVGYQLSMENGNSCWMPWEVRPGGILTTGIIHMDQKKTKKKTFLKRIFSSNKSGKREQEIKYLQCFDSEEREIMVPLITSGVFSPVGDHVTANYDAVYSIHDLLSAFELPIQAQLVHKDGMDDGKLPTGVVVFDRLKDKETVLVAKHPYVGDEDEKFEIPLSDEFPVVREKRKKQQKQLQTELIETANFENDATDQFGVRNSQVDLPIRVKDNKKSKGSAILEKLSVRSKGKKERAGLKALQEQGVFSSRLSKSEINFENMSGGGDVNNETSDNSDNVDTTVRSTNNPPTKSKRDIDMENGYSVSTKQHPMMDRDLPPIPNKTRSSRFANSPYKEGVYEELPLAPRPPAGKPTYATGFNDYVHTADMVDDDYMTPAKFRELNEYDGTAFDVIKSKPPAAPRDSIKYARARKTKSEYIQLPPTFDDDPGESIDQMFEFTDTEESGYGSNQYDRRKRNATYNHPKYSTKRDAYQFQRRSPNDENGRFMDDSAIESRSASGFSKIKSRSHKNLNLESNATIRSHNVRKMRTAMDVFNFSDSLRDLRQPFQNGIDGNQEPTYGRIIDNERIHSYVYGQQNPYGKLATQQHYAESEPAFRRYHRSVSTAALSDINRGDDSAISCGEYGFQGESEYSFSEYSKWQDDNWLPPRDISNLSVLEVSKSLRYIGMKDRVIIRLAHEQIDGSLLCTLDKKLLKEGFPELNALEIKKIVDFVEGWRPKK